MVRPRPPLRSSQQSRQSAFPSSTKAAHNIALCLIVLSAILLFSAYAFLFSLPDALPSEAEVEVAVDKSAAATAPTIDAEQRSGADKGGPGKVANGKERLAEMKMNRPPRTKTVVTNNNNTPKLRPRPHEPLTATPPKSDVGYVVSLTGCPKGADDPLVDGAAVLKHSIHMNSHANPDSGSRYGYKMYSIVHPDAIDCAGPLADIGYELLIRDVPVPVDEIQGNFLRTKVVDNGCCGEKEYIKLHAYTILEHPVVVHLDLDTIVMKPMDDLFDVILRDLDEQPNALEDIEKRLPIMFDKTLPPKVDAFFTRDYNMVKAGKKHVGVQGGFLVIRTGMEPFHEYKEIIREGNFVEGKGWGGLGFGPFYGSLTFQGIVPYFYDALHPNTAVELNRCYYNTMADNPRDQRTVNDKVSGNCRDGRDDCEDCREIDVAEIYTAHFTLCQKPWSCLPHSQDMLQHRLCRKLHHEWFRVRADLEGRKGEGKFDSDQFCGFCNHSGGRGYIPIDASQIFKRDKEE